MIAALVALAPQAAWSHGEEPNVAPTLAAPPAALEAIDFRLKKTLAHQLVVENRSAKTLEVLDGQGVAFLRFDAKGVHANLGARGWYESFTAAGSAMPAAFVGVGERWAHVTADRTWGWFDARLRPGSVKLPHSVEHAKEPTEFAEWTIPLRVDGEPVALSGRFRFAPAPKGKIYARLVSPPEPVPGLTVHTLAGALPGIYLAYTGEKTLVVRGMRGEPFLRIGPDGVHANARSETWRQSGRASVSFERLPPLEADDEPLWQRKSKTPRFSWLEPRAAWTQTALPKSAREDAARTELLRWSIPLEIGEERVAIRGVTDWIPARDGSDRGAARPLATREPTASPAYAAGL